MIHQTSEWDALVTAHENVFYNFSKYMATVSAGYFWSELAIQKSGGIFEIISLDHNLVEYFFFLFFFFLFFFLFLFKLL